MTRSQRLAQNIIEFVFVFLVTMSIFLAIVELGLYWRAQYSVSNIANEITSNLQPIVQNADSEQEVLDAALDQVKKSSSLLNLSDSGFNVSGSNGSYTISSDFKKQNQSALVVFLNLPDYNNSGFDISVAYRYCGIFLFREGKTLTTTPVHSIEKF